MADCLQTWCAAVRRRDLAKPLLVITGEFGCGKSHALRAAHRYVKAIYCDVWPEFWKEPISLATVEFPRFVREVAENANVEHFDDVAGASVAFIDDIGAEEDRFRSGSPARVLGDLLGAREKKFTLLTTNIAPDGWRERWDGRVEDRLWRRSVVCDLYEPARRATSYALWQQTQ